MATETLRISPAKYYSSDVLSRSGDKFTLYNNGYTDSTIEYIFADPVIPTDATNFSLSLSVSISVSKKTNIASSGSFCWFRVNGSHSSPIKIKTGVASQTLSSKYYGELPRSKIRDLGFRIEIGTNGYEDYTGEPMILTLDNAYMTLTHTLPEQLMIKTGGTWVKCSRVYKKIGGVWVQQTSDFANVLGDGKYKFGG